MVKRRSVFVVLMILALVLPMLLVTPVFADDGNTLTTPASVNWNASTNSVNWN